MLVYRKDNLAAQRIKLMKIKSGKRHLATLTA